MTTLGCTSALATRTGTDESVVFTIHVQSSLTSVDNLAITSTSEVAGISHVSTRLILAWLTS